jgi:glycosyltransferase involved in cell wall biosynthesis
MTKLMVFIPVYNCASQLPRVLKQFTPAVQKYFAEIMVVDNGSTDGSREVALRELPKLKHCLATLVHNKANVNLGGSHKLAFNYAKKRGYSHVVVLHGDDQGSIADLIPHIDSGALNQADFLLGARFMPGSRLPGYGLLRIVGNWGFNALFSLVTGRLLYDLGSGLNVFSVAGLSRLPYQKFANNLTFNYYLTLAMCFYRVKYRFFPITWREEDQVSNAKLWRHGLTTLDLLRRYVVGRRRFLNRDYAGLPPRAYVANVIWRSPRRGGK